MSESDSGPDLLNELANDFAERYRRGERPELTEYTAKYPELAAEIRDLFPAMAVIEEFGSVAAGSPGPHAQDATSDGVVPRQLGEYRILREVARGGMGIVYEAVQESLGRHVALKVLPFQSLADKRQLERFRREARAAAMLHHTNIVPVFGVGEHGGVHYFAMQFIRGQTLDSILQELRGRRRAEANDHRDFAEESALIGGGKSGSDLTVSLARDLLTGRFQGEQGLGEIRDDPEAGRQQPVAMLGLASDGSSGRTTEVFGSRSGWQSQSDMLYFRSVARVGLQVAEALAYAHGQGVLHRDIKPANLLLDTEGTAWVTDFGLAKTDDSGDLTNTGDIVGTLRYMAPERFRGQSDPRSDVFSLGLTLYEMATLRPAFAAPVRAQLIERMLHAEPTRPRQLDGRIPRDLETLILKAIAKEPARRYQTAGDLAADLQLFLADRPVQARRSRWPEQSLRWCRRNPVVSSLLVLLFAFLVGGSTISTIAAIRMRELAKAERRAKDSASIALGRERDASRKVIEKADELEWRLYVSRIGQAQSEWIGNSVINTERLLDACPQHLRGWEWSFVKRLCHLDLWTYRGHKENVWSVAFSPDGTRVASGAGPWVYAQRPGHGSLAVCDAASGAEIFRRTDLKGGVQGVTFSPDGSRIATVTGLRGGSPEGSLTIWDGTTGRPVFSRTLPNTNLLCVAFSPDGRKVAAGCGFFNHLEVDAQSSCKLWDARSGEEIRTLPGRAGGVSAIAFHPDGRRIALASWGVVELYDFEDGRLDRSFGGHESYVYAVAFSPDGLRLATGGAEKLARVWDVSTGVALLTLSANRTRGLAFGPDGARLATVSEESLVQLWDTVKGTELSSYRGHRFVASGVAFSPDGRRLASGSADGTVKLWDAESNQPIVYHHPPRRSAFRWITGVAFSPDGRRAVTASRDNMVGIWDTATGRPIRTLEGPPTPGSWEDVFWCVAVSPDGRQIAAGHSEGRLLRWDLETGRELPALQAGRGNVMGVAFSPDGSRIASAGSDRMIRVWDAASGKSVLCIPAHPGLARCMSVAFSPDGSRLVSGGGDFEWNESAAGEVAVWDARTGREIFVHRFPGTSVSHVAFSPDGRQVAAAIKDGTVLVCDAPDGRKIRTFRAHQGPTYDVAFTRDGTRLATAGSDSIRMWDTRTGHEVATLRGWPALCLAFTRDGSRLITGGYLGEARLWDATPLGAEGTAVVSPDPGGGGELPERPTAERPGNDGSDEGGWRSARQRTIAEIYLYSDEPQVADGVRALTHAERAVELDPADGSNWDTLASSYFAIGERSKAISAFAKAIELRPDDFGYRMRHTLALLAEGDTAGYRAACAALLERFGGTTNPAIANNVAWWSSLGPNAVADPGAVVRLAEISLAKSQDAAKSDVLNTLGAALYRAGRHDEAIRHLDERLAKLKDVGGPQDWAFLAMAHHRRGEPAEARRWLGKLQSYKPKITSGLSWDDVEVGILRQEAETQLRDAPTSSR